jgi:hypothetical protein
LVSWRLDKAVGLSPFPVECLMPGLGRTVELDRGAQVEALSSSSGEFSPPAQLSVSPRSTSPCSGWVRLLASRAPAQERIDLLRRPFEPFRRQRAGAGWIMKDEANPWAILSSERLYEDKFISLIRHTVRDASSQVCS